LFEQVKVFMRSIVGLIAFKFLEVIGPTNASTPSRSIRLRVAFGCGQEAGKKPEALRAFGSGREYGSVGSTATAGSILSFS
jgi:hypothetical protein